VSTIQHKTSGHPALLATMPPDRITGRRFLMLAIAITLIGLLLREHFILSAVPEAPIRGDEVQYVAYARNLVQHGVFSLSQPGAGQIVPDAFRGPGYPAFLAVAMVLAEPGPGWYALSLHAQAVLGALTCLLLAWVARRWLGAGWALATAALLAFWPHHIAATGALLVEVLLGFLLTLAMLLASLAIDRSSRTCALAAGLSLGVAALVNPVVVLLPLLFAMVLTAYGRGGAALTLLVAALALTGMWQLRNLGLDTEQASPGRAQINLVQGSWPTYHQAYNAPREDPIARSIMQAISEEEVLMARDPAAGLASLRTRFAEDPRYYLRWYLLEKPYLLWAWDIRIGAGDVYFHRVAKSPLETNPTLNAIKRGLRSLNPLLFALALVAALGTLLTALRRQSPPPAAVLLALSFLYFTSIHIVFQAEPRYSIAYRPIELALAVGALSVLLSWRRVGGRIRHASGAGRGAS